MSLAKDAYRIAKLLPSEERYALGDQIRRCAVSIPSNIAEGYGRQSDKEFLHFLYISKGSLFELETQILLGSEMNGHSELTRPTFELIRETSKMLNGLINYVKERNETKSHMVSEPEIPYDL